MVPQPRKQNPQLQPLTVSLRNICRDYPAGAGVLKELLQNADDAGASTIVRVIPKFVLDTSSHPNSPVLVDGLSDYQGPALLAYNDALFSERDFQSLTSLGDSQKIQDKAATGKFGLGFNSVFNWTDCPSVLSGSTLLFLDPHHSWSRIFDPPGGPDYEFPCFAKDEAMMNQLHCFSLLNTEWEKPFCGTIIRIPLRNAYQALWSEISQKEIIPDDIRDSMNIFADEMGSSGLLFLKSVQRIALSINDEQLNEVEVVNRHDLTEPKQRLKGILARSMNRDDQIGVEIYHEVGIRHWFEGREIVKHFGILNLVAGSIHDSSLMSWAASEKLFPWVAVAAPLKNLESSTEVGRLFSTLPLPILTGLPVHIHGRFSISADRSRLHGLDDKGVQDHRPKDWNKLLFDEMIPTAWAKLLGNICQNCPTENHFHLWPTKRSDTRELWYDVCSAVVDHVSQNHLPVWFTEVGHVALESGLLASEEIQLEEKMALRESKLPVIFMVRRLFDEALQRAGSRKLQPWTLYECLRRIENFGSVSSQSRLVFLEILLLEVPLPDLGALEVFPFVDGNFRSLRTSPVFLHRDSFEKALFTKQMENSIDTDRLSDRASKLLHEQVRKDEQLVRYRTPEDLRDYFLNHIVNGSGDVISFDADRMSALQKVWDWVLRYSRDRLPLSALGPLWLIPIRGSGVRKLVPLDASSSVTWFHPGEVKDLSLKISALDTGSALKILADGELSEMILQCLRCCTDHEPSLLIKDGNKFENFLELLAQSRDLLQIAAEDVKASVLCTLRTLYWSRSQTNTDFLFNTLKSLYLFKAVEWPANAISMTRHSTDMTRDVAFIGLSKLVPVPLSAECIFLDVSNENERALFEDMGILKCLNEVQILEEIVIPGLRDGGYDEMHQSFRLEVATLLFRNYYHISPSAQSCLSSLAVVPLEKRDEDNSSIFVRPLDILDPQNLKLRNLYFEDEVRMPEKGFYNRFSAILAECGMVQSLNECVVLDRIRNYGRRDLGYNVVASRARSLLEMPFQRDIVQPDNLIKVIRESEWLPALAPDGSDSFTNSAECRDSSDEPLVGHVWHILPFHIDKSWILILGWDECVDVDVLISQLDRTIAAGNVHSIDQTLSYIHQHHAVENYADRLLKLKFVRGSNGEHADAVNFCRQGVERLTPYLFTVEPRFWDDHSEIMTLANIPELPKLEQLTAVQKALESKNCLNEQDLDVAIELARIWGTRFPEVVDRLRMPNDNAVLVELGDLVFNDTPWLSAGTRAILHPKVSRIIAEQLKIEPLSELVRNGDLGIADPDDDEFYQREEIADGIRDTLDRYTREHTFHEYLANADDCGSASEVNFLFDGTTYGTKYLLSEDLQGLQGPSLLIHNDGVFTAADFEGLKYVGRGRKREDPTTIGKFGRGSQTMYHWTDVPMILSGDHLLILDPLRKHLPFSYRTRQKKPGILVKCAKLKPSCQDQLAPFEGLWGFDSDQGFYKGTIFRFPLRSIGQSSELVESRSCPDALTTIQLFRKTFDEARLALLFLRNIATIDFSVKGGIDCEWRVRRGNWPQSGTFSDWANIIVEQHNDLGEDTFATEQWWRVIEDVRDAPTELQHRHKRRMKHVECGIAAFVPQTEKEGISSLQSLKSRFFNCLPLKFESTLPVHIHATFLLSGDRQNIATEETSQDAGSEWNKWLLQKKLPHVYLHFLEDIGRKVGQDVYKYFPVEFSERQHLLSDIIRTSFWEYINSSRCRLFPVMEVSHDLRVAGTKVRKNRTAPNMITFGCAVFDVLEQPDSALLQPLLDGCLDDLVRPPLDLANYIKCVPEVKVLTPAIVRSVLKSQKAARHVEEAKENDKNFLDALLSFIMPTTTADTIELDGCPVLPLANGRLGTLSLKSKVANSGTSKMYFSANSECRGLFSFASSILTTSNENFVKKIADSGLLNLKPLEKSDLSVMLDCKESWTAESTSHTWLFQLWTYMNSTTQSTTDASEAEALDLDSIQDYALLLVRHRGGKETLGSLHHFSNNPVVVQTAVEEHMNLFRDIPGLGVVDSKTMPESYREAEKSLSDRASMNRFLKAIQSLAIRNATSVTELMRANLGERSIKTLQEIISIVTQDGIGLSLPDIANDLPIWPRISSKSGYLTTEEAIMAQNPALVVPWIKDYDQFAKFSGLRPGVSIDDVGMLERYVLPALPEFIDEENKLSYIRLINAISLSSSLKQRISKKNKTRRFVIPLTMSRLAARLDGKLCLANELFDHDDSIFSAAFRFEATGRFLMFEARKHLALWNELGIHRRELGRFNASDYLACLHALESRLTSVEDQELANDIERVLYPLCTNDGALIRLDDTTWSTIARLPLFLVRPVFGGELEHRRRRMECLVSQRHPMCLKDIIRQEFAAVCWSQTPFVLHEPSSFSIQKSGSRDQPPWAMVWDHLAFLAELVWSIEEAQVQVFLEDLQRTYEYLNLNPQESKSQFAEPNAAVWLNADTTSSSTMSLEALRSSWTSLDYLLLDSPCDAPPLMTVQPFLGRFSTLLKELGCKSLLYPSINATPPGTSQTALSLLRKLWEEGVLTDVTFEAEGNTLSAHQCILASRSLYCKAQFHGPWALASESKVKNKVIELKDMTHATLRILIEFCYHEHHDWSAGMQVAPDDSLSTIADKLDVLLDVLVAADRWLMPDLHIDAQRQVIAGIRFFIRPDNVGDVQKVAEEANATELRDYCEEYRICNAEAVLLAHADSG